MANNLLGDLVKLAKGERTLKEYERDSGVDAAVISKIISGKYQPQKLEVYRNLTSEKAAPRGNVTYEKLMEAAEHTAKAYKAGIMAGVAASETVLAMLGGLPMAALQVGTTGIAVAGAKVVSERKSKENSKKSEEALSNVQRFAAASVGMIYSNMAKKGIYFRPQCSEEINLLKNERDTYIQIEGQRIKGYLLRYVYLSDEERNIDYIIASVGKRIVEQLVFLKPDASRKVSIVVNCKEIYDYLLRYKKNLSYRGNLSIILSDIEKVFIEKEEYISYYDEKNESDLMLIV